MAESFPPNGKSPSFKQRFAVVSRWLHIYLSMVSFAIVFFFAVTGLTLNHTEWFADQQSTTPYKGKVEEKWVKTDNDEAVAKLEIVEFLRRAHNIKTAVSDLQWQRLRRDYSERMLMPPE